MITSLYRSVTLKKGAIMNDFKGTAAFMRLIADVSKSLSEESITKAFSEQSFEKVAQCKSTEDFLSFLKDLNLPELKLKWLL